MSNKREQQKEGIIETKIYCTLMCCSRSCEPRIGSTGVGLTFDTNKQELLSVTLEQQPPGQPSSNLHH